MPDLRIAHTFDLINDLILNDSCPLKISTSIVENCGYLVNLQGEIGINKFKCIFIRAPKIKNSDEYFLIYKNILVTSFHPELTNDI